VASAAGADRAPRDVSIGVFPSSTTIRGNAPLPATPARSVSLKTATGEQEDAMVVVSGAKQVRVIAPATVGPLPLKVMFAHYVSFGGTLVPDALLPWDGSTRNTEQENQPIWLQVTVPLGTAPGTYTAEVSVVADGNGTTVPVSVSVFPVALPPPNQVAGNLLTAFHVSAETYGNTVGKQNGYTLSTQFQGIGPSLYSFLASYRISPSSWGFGAPSQKSGYTSSRKWWLDSATNMTAEMKNGSFAAMAIPISNNRTSPSNYIAGLSPNHPETWCSYLKSVHAFWQQHGWTSSLPYAYGMDEPGLAGMRVVAKQASAVHSCFPGGKAIVTGNPSQNNSFLWDGGNDDVDAWVVLANRYYGQYTNPKQSRAGISYARNKQKVIDAVRARGKMIWTYTYPNTRTPGFTATEPLSNSRMLFLWSALENIRGVLYGEGTTNYKGNPFESVAQNGAFVLLYPGKESPVPSARLEQIRDGIEDWDILQIARQKRGAGAIQTILGAGLFSADAAGVKLGCTIGCPVKTATPFSWPTYSQDGSTPGKIEQAKAQALKAAS
jgi:hypothetical protein